MVARQDLWLRCEEHPCAVITLCSSCAALPGLAKPHEQPSSARPRCCLRARGTDAPSSFDKGQPGSQRCHQHWAPACLRAQALPSPPTDVLWLQQVFPGISWLPRGQAGMCPCVLALLSGNSAVLRLLCVIWAKKQGGGCVLRQWFWLGSAAAWEAVSDSPCLVQSSSCPTTSGVCQSWGLWHCSVVAMQDLSESGLSSRGVGPLWAQPGQDRPCKLLGQLLQESPGPAAAEPCWWRGCGCTSWDMIERTNKGTYRPSHKGTRLNNLPALPPDKSAYR